MTVFIYWLWLWNQISALESRNLPLLFFLPCSTQMTPASSLWLSSLASKLLLHLWMFGSVPAQKTLSRIIGPVPCPKWALDTACASGAEVRGQRSDIIQHLSWYLRHSVRLTSFIESQLPAYHPGIIGAPVIISNGSPHSLMTHLHSALCAAID